MMSEKTSALLAKAGFIPLPAWLGLSTLAGLLAVGYDPIASHVSVMTLEDNLSHTLANIAALAVGLSLLVFGTAVWAISGRVFSAGAACWMIFGVAMISNGIWPMGTPMHGFYVIGIFNILAPALSLLDVQSAELRSKLYAVTVFVSLAGVTYLWLLLTGFEPEGYSGLFQRFFGSINLVWPLLFAYYHPRLGSEIDK